MGLEMSEVTVDFLHRHLHRFPNILLEISGYKFF